MVPTKATAIAYSLALFAAVTHADSGEPTQGGVVPLPQTRRSFFSSLTADWSIWTNRSTEQWQRSKTDSALLSLVVSFIAKPV